MSADGTYTVVYSGDVGVGGGIFTIRDNNLEGTDIWNGKYSGSVKEGPDGYDLVIEMTVPPDVLLAQGTAPQPVRHTRTFAFDLPADFDSGGPITRVIGPGKLTVMIRRASDDWAKYASGMKVTISPVP